MKLNNDFAHTGLCRVCGKNTRLLIHAECGRKMDAERSATKAVTQKKYAATQKKYKDGYVPSFANY